MLNAGCNGSIHCKCDTKIQSLKQLYTAYKDYYRLHLNLAIPVVISQLGHTFTHLADSVIVGHFAGTAALAAVSLVNSLFSIMMVIGIGISYGLTPLIAQENGRKNFGECSKLLSNSLLINTLSGLFLFGMIYFGVTLTIDHLNQDEEVVRLAKPYLALLGASIIPLMIFNTFKQFAEGLGFTKQAMMISIVGNLINIILGITFVKGLFGIAPMGVRGVGLSTLIDRSIMALAMGSFVLGSKYFKDYRAGFGSRLINKIYIYKILKIGAPVAMQYAFEVSAFSGAAVLMGIIGVAEQAAHQIALNLAAMTYMMASGLSTAATILTGNNFGKRDFNGVKLTAASSYHIVLAFMSITAILLCLFRTYIPLMYTADTNVISIAAQLLLIAAIFQLFDGAQVVGLGILRGMGDVNIPTIITFLAYWVIGLPVAYVLGLKTGLRETGIWYGLTSGLLISALLLFIRYKIMVRRLMLQA